MLENVPTFLSRNSGSLKSYNSKLKFWLELCTFIKMFSNFFFFYTFRNIWQNLSKEILYTHFMHNNVFTHTRAVQDLTLSLLMLHISLGIDRRTAVTRCWIAAARPLLAVSRSFMNVVNRVLWRMMIILKANKVNLSVSSVLFVFWYHSPNVLDTPHIWSSL
jgi:hypothetical protein